MYRGHLPYIAGNNNWYLHVIGDVADNKIIANEEVSFVVYYLEIPSGYTIPENIIASSDEAENDEGFSPQSSAAPETKQFHGESLYE